MAESSKTRRKRNNWPELEELLFQILALRHDSQLVCKVLSRGIEIVEQHFGLNLDLPEDQQKVTAAIVGIQTEDDIQKLLPFLHINHIKEAVKIFKGVMRTLGGRESIKEWQNSVDDFLQFWIDVDLENLPVSKFTKEEIIQNWENSSKLIHKSVDFFKVVEASYNFDQLLHFFGVNLPIKDIRKMLETFPTLFTGRVAKALLDPRGINGFAEILNLPPVFMIPELTWEKELHALNELIKIIFSILDELRDKHFLGIK